MALGIENAALVGAAAGQFVVSVILAWVTVLLYRVEKDLATSSRTMAEVAAEERRHKQAEFEIIRAEPTEEVGSLLWYWVDVVNRGWMDGAIQSCIIRVRFDDGASASYVPRIFDGEQNPDIVHTARPTPNLTIPSGDRKRFFLYWGKAGSTWRDQEPKDRTIRCVVIEVEPVIGKGGAYRIDHDWSIHGKADLGDEPEPFGNPITIKIAGEPTHVDRRPN